MRYRRKTIERWKYDGLLMMSLTLLLSLVPVGIEKIYSQEFHSPVGRDPIIIEKPVPVEVDRPIPVSKLAFQCMENYPDTVEKIKMYFGNDYLDAVELYCRESSLNHMAVNPSSGACGLVQALPCAKMGCELWDLDCQLKWGREYINQRYGDAATAVEFHDRMDWY